MSGGMMSPGMMPQGGMPMGQPGMMQPGMGQPGAMPGIMPSGSAPRQPGEMTPQEEQEFLKKIERLQQEQQKAAPTK